MKTKTINGVTLFRRSASSSCPKGAWFGQKHHTSWIRGYWVVFEIGTKGMIIADCRTALEAQRLIAKLEKTED
ncbi:MAG: hypothetical protein Q8J68_14545 [Methanolobus sp.]|uniref:hypothetical protein n=1 Tax=Methanolobus sp. TaxID=1874737 RepID=UPI00272FA1F6|nr:hypothetical protein [Methanolobus sp.]MDP2218493.1 hypothetical protein [Methanolobus sp.]